MFQNAKQLARHLDHTLLGPLTDRQQVRAVCDEALKYGFASVCIPPAFVGDAATRLSKTPVKVSTVIGFPLGYHSVAVKIVEAMEAVKQGAQELDIVIHLGLFKSGEEDYILSEIQNIRNVSSKQLHKIIIETGCLNTDEKIRACRLVLKSGARFVKTSTGFGFPGATVDDVRLLKKEMGPEGKVKASGGIRDIHSAVALINAGASRIGTSAAVTIMEQYQRLLKQQGHRVPA